jgi:superfamily I DNA/RNA helicase
VSNLYTTLLDSQPVATPDIKFATMHGIASSILGDSARYARCVTDLLLEISCYSALQSTPTEPIAQNQSKSPIKPNLRSDLHLHYNPATADSTTSPLIDSATIHNSAQVLHETFGILSYNHLLIAAIEHLSTHTMHNPPRYLFVDEGQDLSAPGWRLLDCLIDEAIAWHGAIDVYIVGDPNQSIYQFQGASRALWDRWQKRLGASQTINPYCYRCSDPIIQVVNALYKPQHFAPQKKSGWVRCTPGYSVHLAIKELHQGGAEYDEILVLVRRRGARLERLIEELDGIPLSGLTSNLGIRIVRPFFSAINNPNDDDLAEILYALYAASDVTRALIERDGSVYKLISEKYGELRTLLERLDSRDCVGCLKVLQHYVAVHPELFELAAKYTGECGGHTDGFVTYCLEQGLCTESIHGCVRLLTIHSAKGLQAKYVILADATEAPRARGGGFYYDGEFYDDIPENAWMKEAVDQEAEENLLYVALTRAECGVLLCGEGVVGKDSFVERVQSAFHRIGVAGDELVEG